MSSISVCDCATLWGHREIRLSVVYHTVCSKWEWHASDFFCGIFIFGYELKTHCEKNAIIHQVTIMLATSKNVLFPGHNHLLTTWCWWLDTLIPAKAPASFYVICILTTLLDFNTYPKTGTTSVYWLFLDNSHFYVSWVVLMSKSIALNSIHM